MGMKVLGIIAGIILFIVAVGVIGLTALGLALGGNPVIIFTIWGVMAIIGIAALVITNRFRKQSVGPRRSFSGGLFWTSIISLVAVGIVILLMSFGSEVKILPYLIAPWGLVINFFTYITGQ